MVHLVFLNNLFQISMPTKYSNFKPFLLKLVQWSENKIQ